MDLLFNKVFFQHDTGMHPENRKRLEAFAGLEDTSVIDGTPFLNLVHDKSYIERVKTAHLLSAHLDPDTAISAGSFEAAVAAVGATIMASNSGDFALVRHLVTMRTRIDPADFVCLTTSPLQLRDW